MTGQSASCCVVCIAAWLRRRVVSTHGSNLSEWSDLPCGTISDQACPLAQDEAPMVKQAADGARAASRAGSLDEEAPQQQQGPATPATPANGGAAAAAAAQQARLMERRILPVCFALYSAAFGTFTVVFSKLVAIFIRLTTSGEQNMFLRFDLYIYIVMLVVTGISWDKSMNAGLRLFPAVIIMPVMQVRSTLSTFCPHAVQKPFLLGFIVMPPYGHCSLREPGAGCVDRPLHPQRWDLLQGV